MPEIILNVSGTTRTTGTANPVISGVTGTSGPMTDVPDGTEVFYVRRYSSNKPGFENCIGIWRSATDTIERTSVEKSSNGGGAVVWGVGEQTIDISISPDMIVADDDPRLVNEDLDDFTPATNVTGIEKVATTQDGDPVSMTAQQIAGNPIRAQLGHDKTKNKSFSNFTKLSKTFFAADGSSGVAAGLEPFLCYASGTGSAVANTQLFTQVSQPTINTGTTTTGRACLEHIEYPILYLPTLLDRDYRKTLGIGGILPAAGVEEYTLQCGFSNNAPEIATLGSGLGVFFELKTGDTNWHAVWISAAAGAGNLRRVDTGVVATAAAFITLRIHLVSHPTIGANRKALFYIDGDLVATILENDGGHTSMAAGTRLSMLEVIKKAAGTTGASFNVAMHYSEIENPAPLVGLDV